MINYFSNCQTLEDAKALYHKLAMANHPDRGGDVRIMQEINAQYARFQSEFTYHSERARQAAAHAEGKKTAADYHDLEEVIEILRVKIEAVLNLGLTAELCGLWVWVSGDTRPQKEELKTLQFKWAHDKEAWYFAGVPSFNRKPFTMDEIRNQYGSRTFTKAAQPEEEKCQAIPAGGA
jgi:hypothetical protein